MPQDPKLKHNERINPKDPTSPWNLNVASVNDDSISGRKGYPIRPENFNNPMDLVSYNMMGKPVNDFWEKEELANVKKIGEYKKAQKAKERATMKYNEKDYDGSSAMFGKTALSGTQSNSVSKDDRYRRGMNIKK
jgi:hypothetical protein